MNDLTQRYESQMATLRPLMERIQRTDELIDQIVYKLYGLTEEEIKIVEGCQRISRSGLNGLRIFANTIRLIRYLNPLTADSMR